MKAPTEHTTSALNFSAMKVTALLLVFLALPLCAQQANKDTDATAKPETKQTFTIQTIEAKSQQTIPLLTAVCVADSVPGQAQPVMEDGFLEFKFSMDITPVFPSGPIAAHEIDCGTYTFAFPTAFTLARTSIIFGTLQAGTLSSEMELTFPDGTHRTFYEDAEAYATITGPSSAVRNSGGISKSVWPIKLTIPAGTQIHFNFNYAVPDPQHSCNPRCTVVGNNWLQNDK